MNIPALTKEAALKILQPYAIQDKIVVLGIRGFGEGANKIAIYDDCLAIVSQDFFQAYNANTDPSRSKPNVAVLQPGVYRYTIGLHGVHHLNLNIKDDRKIYDTIIANRKDPEIIPGRILPYWALRQKGNVTVLRVGKTEPETDSPTNRFYIDIHKGGYNTTSSEGCQTIYPDQWKDFFWTHVKPLMEKYQQPEISYVLVNE